MTALQLGLQCPSESHLAGLLSGQMSLSVISSYLEVGILSHLPAAFKELCIILA